MVPRSQEPSTCAPNHPAAQERVTTTKATGAIEQLGRPRPELQIHDTPDPGAEVPAAAARFKVFEPSIEDPRKPTRHPPGSIEKMEVMASRARLKIPMFVIGDARLARDLGYVPSMARRGLVSGAAAIVQEMPDGQLQIVGKQKLEISRAFAGRKSPRTIAA